MRSQSLGVMSAGKLGLETNGGDQFGRFPNPSRVTAHERLSVAQPVKMAGFLPRIGTHPCLRGLTRVSRALRCSTGFISRLKLSFKKYQLPST